MALWFMTAPDTPVTECGRIEFRCAKGPAALRFWFSAVREHEAQRESVDDENSNRFSSFLSFEAGNRVHNKEPK